MDMDPVLGFLFILFCFLILLAVLFFVFLGDGRDE